MSDISYRLAKEVEAAKVLRDRYKDAFGEDAELIADTIEGETTLFEKLDTMIGSIGDDQALVGATKEREKGLADRRRRIEKRIELKRALILTALQIAETKSFELPNGTVGRTAVGDKAIITDEALVPAAFFTTPEPALSKTLVNQHYGERFRALKAAAKIADLAERKAAIAKINEEFPELPGVTVSNGGETLSLSFK